MKIKSVFVAVLMLCTASVALAQNKSYGKVYVSFNAGGISASPTGVLKKADLKRATGGIDGIGTVGFSAGMVGGISLTKKCPLYLELGGEVNYATGSTSLGEDVDVNAKMLNLQVPVNFTYQIPIVEKFAIAPFVGVNFKVNILGTIGDDDYEVNYNVFDEDEMKMLTGLDVTANRFQVGMNLGVNFILFKKLSLGYRFQPDFIDYYSYEIKEKKTSAGIKVATNNHYISVGYQF